jgi:hypothetical protein
MSRRPNHLFTGIAAKQATDFPHVISRAYLAIVFQIFIRDGSVGDGHPPQAAVRPPANRN